MFNLRSGLAVLTAVVLIIALVASPAAASSASYDYVLQIKDGTSKHIKLYGTDKIDEALTEPPADLDPAADTSSTSLCVLGEYDAGKTFLTNSLLGTSLASGTNYSTVGVSWKTAELTFESMRMRATVYDFAGFGLPADTADGKRRLAFTEHLLDDIAAQLACLPVIVVPKLTEAARQYIDSLVDHMFQVRSQRIREATNGKSSLKELDVVVVVNNRLAKSNDQLYQEMTMSHVPLEPADTDVYAPSTASSANAAAATTDQERAILHFSRRTESVHWRGSDRRVKFHIAFLRNVDGGAFSKQLLENARELVLRQARSQHRQQQQQQKSQQQSTNRILAAVERSTQRLCGTERVDVRWVGTGNLDETLENFKGAASVSGFTNPLVDALSNAFWAGVAYVRGGGGSGSGGAAESDHTTAHHRQYYRGTFELDYDGNPVSWQFRYGVGTRQVGVQGFDVTKVQIVAPGCGYRETAFETNDQRSFVKVSCTLAADEEWTELLAASPVGRSEWLIDYFEDYPFCPEQTMFNNGIISVFFGTKLACKQLALDLQQKGEAPSNRPVAASFDETHIGNDAKGNVRTRVTYRDPADVSWTDRVASLHSERSSVAGMFTATVSCIAVFATAARSLLAKASSTSATAAGATATAVTQPAPARVSAAQWAMLVTVPGLAMIFLSPVGVFDRIAAGVMWAHRTLRQLGVL